MDETTDAGPPTEPEGVRFALGARREFYGVRRFLTKEGQDAAGLRIPVDVYFKDPLVAAEFPGVGIDTGFTVPWEPGIGDGPTSARFAVVDFDATTGTLSPPARWDAANGVFRGVSDEILDQHATDTTQYRQMSTWAVVQNTLDHFENAFGLGRRILWGFQGNRLIVVPNAGYGQNAYYDRQSKSLQFYYFDDGDARVHTCLSSDIVVHELGHAILDGIRPYFLESVTPQTAAFHEFVGDLTAILMVFRNNRFRKEIAKRAGDNLAGEVLLSGIARQFGEAAKGQDYLRSATNERTMANLPTRLEPHDVSEVLTGAMFDFLLRVSVQYRTRGKNISVADALWYTVQRVQTMAIQALDLLPPVEATFADYARAMLRAEAVANPTDPAGYRKMLADVFIARGILDGEEGAALLAPDYVFAPLALDVFHDVRDIASSRAAAYRFLDDNRRSLFIPYAVDPIIADVFTAEKLSRAGQRLPKQVILQYVWREEMVLEGPRFGAYAGQTTSLLCGGTLVLDENGNTVAWARKPGAQACGTGKRALAEAQEGAARRARYLDDLAASIGGGKVGAEVGGAAGLIAEAVPLFAARTVDGTLRFELTPHVSAGHNHNAEATGGRPWQMSS
ncbi:gluzincin family metallopeptidase [Roseixanthobacter liquoris]|uniref:serine protease n=1 Tax=Roseixanthobacter liquoris TaxID=3119921 RepID=UPI0037271F29